MTRACIAAAAALLLLSCGVEPKKSRGAQCELNSECDAPLVCRIGHCRIECATTRDCAVGLACLLDADGLGSCQLPEELACDLASDCTPPLVCVQSECVNQCAEDRDCPPGATCVDGGCIDPSEQPCVMHSDCRTDADQTLVCAHDGRCRIECRNDRECRYGTTCRGNVCMPGGSAVDAGAGIDGGAATDGGAGIDGGGVDAGPTADGGRTCGTMPPADIEVGDQFSCGIFTNGADRSVWCWGSPSNGRLGIPDDGLTRPDPVQVPGIVDAQVLALGSAHACVLRSDSTVWCWGRNFAGELGDGTTTSRPTPMPVTGVSDAVWVAAGYVNTCVAHDTGAVSCWGERNNGASGDGTVTMGSRTTPNQILPPGRVIPARDPVTVGDFTGCAADSMGAECWGQGTEGQLADGTTNVRPSPSPAMIPVPVTALDLGGLHGCSVNAGAVWCWGMNGAGQLGDGTTTDSYVPVRATGLAGVTNVRVGVARTCAIDGTGALYCWGSNLLGRLGDGTTTDRPTPTALGITGVTDVALGPAHACAIAGGQVWCWGRNASRELGDPTVGSSTMPIRVACPP